MPVQVGTTTGTIFRGDRTKLPTGTTDPSTAEEGDLFYNTDTNKVRVYDGPACSMNLTHPPEPLDVITLFSFWLSIFCHQEKENLLVVILLLKVRCSNVSKSSSNIADCAISYAGASEQWNCIS